jgi:hypothetical protein
MHVKSDHVTCVKRVWPSKQAMHQDYYDFVNEFVNLTLSRYHHFIDSVKARQMEESTQDAEYYPDDQ